MLTASALVCARRYGLFLTMETERNKQFDHPRDLLTKAFEHLFGLGLVAYVEPRPKSLANDQLPLRLSVDPEVVYEYVKHSKDMSVDIRRFGTMITL